MSERVIILDTTLRDELSNRRRFGVEARVEIALRLADAGVDVIEAGYVGASPVELEAIRRVAAEVRSSRVAALVRAEPEDIEVAADALRGGDGRLHVFLVCSAVADPSPEEWASAVAKTEAMVQRAKDRVEDIEFSLVNGTRAEPRFLADVARAALAGGASTFNLTDQGIVLPEELARLVKRLRRDVPEIERAVLSFHGHDDRGLAADNVAAALQAGVRQIEVAVSGIGERAGNASLQAVAAILGEHGARPGLAAKLDEGALPALAALVDQRSRDVASLVM